MKNSAGSLALVYKFLLILFICLALVFLGGTAFSLFFRQENVPILPAAGDHTFTGIGLLRLTAADSSGSGPGPVVILSVTFPYDPNDRPFSEELAARVRDFRTIAADYFITISSEDLKKMNEDQIKGALLERFNRILRLGKIETLYFNDYIILE